MFLWFDGLSTGYLFWIFLKKFMQFDPFHRWFMSENLKNKQKQNCFVTGWLVWGREHDGHQPADGRQRHHSGNGMISRFIF